LRKREKSKAELEFVRDIKSKETILENCKEIRAKLLKSPLEKYYL